MFTTHRKSFLRTIVKISWQSFAQILSQLLKLHYVSCNVSSRSSAHTSKSSADFFYSAPIQYVIRHFSYLWPFFSIVECVFFKSLFCDQCIFFTKKLIGIGSVHFVPVVGNCFCVSLSVYCNSI